MSVKYRVIDTFSDFINFIEEDCADRFALFRGQPVDKPLLPRIARVNLKNKLPVTELNIIKNFKLLSSPYLKAEPTNEWEWLAIAQHHGLVTRLLDWTESPLVALWFVVNKPPEKDSKGKECSGVVWVFKPQPKHHVTLEDEQSSPYIIRGTKVYQPKHVTPRITAQSGWFTVHKYLENADKFIRMESMKVYKRYLTKIIIPPERFANLRRSLDRCNINASTVFPDIDGLCKLIEWENVYFVDEIDISNEDNEVFDYIAVTSEKGINK